MRSVHTLQALLQVYADRPEDQTHVVRNPLDGPMDRLLEPINVSVD